MEAELNDNEELDSNLIELYSLLIDQLQKYNSILWQFPIAIMAANTFALDKLLEQPLILLCVAVIDAVLIYALRNLVRQQQAIISATKSVEENLKKTIHRKAIPNFESPIVRAPPLIVYALSAGTLILMIYSLVKVFGG